jgi:hypothetical protein
MRPIKIPAGAHDACDCQPFGDGPQDRATLLQGNAVHGIGHRGHHISFGFEQGNRLQVRRNAV